MVLTELQPLAELFHEDETAWLDRMSELIRQRRISDLDLHNLAEYLTELARRDRREVKSRLAILLAHLLKWEYQPDRRSNRWRATIVVQRQELGELIGSGVLRVHADDVLMDCYENAIAQAVAETGLTDSTFATECPYTIEQLLNSDFPI